jgi:hypothetical protein
MANAHLSPPAAQNGSERRSRDSSTGPLPPANATPAGPLLPAKGGVLAALRRLPLVGVDLSANREKTEGRSTSLEIDQPGRRRRPVGGLARAAASPSHADSMPTETGSAATCAFQGTSRRFEVQ